jgi:acyl-coenzyme A synthetase/AMP-(fatty) acid ligase
MLACARIEAVHSFAGFSAEALATRINDGIHSFNLTLYKLF